MNYNFVFSVIVPHRNSTGTLPRLFDSIPQRKDLEIIVVDNSPTPIKKEDIASKRPFKLLYSDPQRGAGCARNVGIESATGKWLLFADADDFYSKEAFEVFYNKTESDADLIYTGMGGMYLDTGERSDRGDGYTKLVKQFLNKEIPESDLRFKFSSPCCKMVRHDMVNKYGLRYDEVAASNDMYFSMLCGYHAKTIEAVDIVSYIATVSKGTLTKRRDYTVISARYGVYLRYNKFLKNHGYSEYQRSVLNYALSLCRMGVRPAWEAVVLLIKYRQNLFVGYQNWIATLQKKKTRDKVDSKYIVK